MLPLELLSASPIENQRERRALHLNSDMQLHNDTDFLAARDGLVEREAEAGIEYKNFVDTCLEADGNIG